MNFQYAALPERTIRLLRILPQVYPKESEQVINIELECVYLDDDLTYDALSYTWGPSSIEDGLEEEAQIFTRVARCYPVVCNSRLIQITKSLRDALLRLRAYEDPATKSVFEEHWEKKKSRSLWADGLCINQDDLKERATQVSYMTELYRKANLVFAWIGQKDESSSRGFKACLALGQIQPGHERKQGCFSFLREEFYSGLELKSFSPSDIFEFLILLSRAWFFRTWVMQEITLPRAANVLIQCGNSTQQLSAFTKAIAGLTSNNVSRNNLVTSMDQMPAGSHQRLDLYRNHIRDWLRFGHPFAMFSVLPNFKPQESEPRYTPFPALTTILLSKTECMDPRDRIHAASGLAQELQIPGILVDYQAPIEEVFCEATRHVIMVSKSLDILMLVEIRRPYPDLPSWCPAFDQYAGRPSPVHEKLSGNSMWFASRSTPFASGSLQSKQQLGLRGRYLSSIVNIVDVSKALSLSDADAWDPSACVAFARLIKESNERHDNGTVGYVTISPSADGNEDVTAECNRHYKFPTQAILRTMIFDCYNDELGWSSQDTPASDIIIDLALYSILSRGSTLIRTEEYAIKDIRSAFIEIQKHTKNLSPSLDPWVWDFLLKEIENREKGNIRDHGTATNVPGLDDSRLGARIRLRNWRQQCERFVLSMAHICRGRVLFTTSDNYVGLGHATCMANDEIWLLEGGKAPFILRPSGTGRKGHYRLVGYAYVHGVMSGERWPSDDTTLKNIVLE